MVNLPADFVAETRRIMGDERFNRYLGAFDEEAPTSVRVNVRREGVRREEVEEQVPWCKEGFYLTERPQFTFDPLLHAGCYYVQEASSMFVTHILRNYTSSTPYSSTPHRSNVAIHMPLLSTSWCGRKAQHAQGHSR